MNYERKAKRLKAIAEPNRMKIIHLLSSGTMCACDVLDYFDFTQPTLSYHMKRLEKAQIISVEKRGQWHYYTLEATFMEEILGTMKALLSENEEQTSKCCENQTNQEVIQQMKNERNENEGSDENE